MRTAITLAAWTYIAATLPASSQVDPGWILGATIIIALIEDIRSIIK